MAMFTCEKCGKEFTEKRSLLRHMKTHADSLQTYSCSICDKVFSRADHRKRHEAAHSYSLSCGVCGQYFNRLDNLARHRAQHERPEAKQRPPMKRPVATEPGPVTKQRRTVSPPTKTPVENPVGPDVLPEDPETRALYRRHWQSIRTEETTGNRVQDRYNFTLHEMTASTFPEMVHRIFGEQTTAFKINVSFGFFLRHMETGELRYYHSSQNNSRFFDVPHLIRNEEDLERFLDELQGQDILEFIRQQRPDTKWVVHLLTNVTFYVNKLFEHPIGARVVLPDHILKNKAVVGLVTGSHGPHEDNLCFFRCLAVHRGTPVKDVEVPAKTYYHQYLQHQDMTPADFKGVTLDDLVVLEQVFSLNVYVYDLQETEAGDIAARLVRRSPYSYQETMNLNLYEQHFSYVSNMEKYSHSYLCSKCDRLWKHVGTLHRHERTCTGDVIYKYPGGVYHTTQTVFDRLEDEGIEVPEEDRYYPYRATYDIEVMLQPTDKRRSEKLEWTSHHVLLSVSVCSNVPTYTEPICFVSEGDTSETVDSCLSYLTDISEKAFRLLVPRYGMVFEEIQQRLDQDLEEYKDDEEREREEKKHHLYQLKQQLERYLQELPVVGFNTGKYDVNAMKVDFFTRLVDSHKIKYTVKRNNNFMCIKTEKMKFLDITNYLAPGFSYSQYLKAYKCTEQKGFFPYEWMTSLDKLNVSQLPPHEAFFSTLKNENISAEDYQLCLNVWQENDMKTMKEFLVWYNNKDVEPMLEAIDKMFQFNQNRRIDMFKDGISVPGLVLKYMFQDLPDYFTVPDEKNKDVYDLYKNSIVGGPSIIFHRYHEKDKTFIRPAEYTDPKPCQLIYGVDANALYLWCIMQKMPTGHFVRRKKEDGFKRQAPRRYERMAIEWLEWEAKSTGQHIRHQGNDKEKVIGRRRLPVDGFCKETNTVYEFQGCLWHGHRCWITKDKSVNPINGKNLNDLFKTTREKIDEIKDQGYDVKQMWECEWGRLKKQDPELKAFVKDMQRPCDRYSTMSEESILQAVMDEKLFGALEVDLEVPDHLKSKFAEMPPIFKNIDVSRDDIGDHMKAYAEEKGIMNQKRKCLIGSMHGEKIMVISPLLKWYVEHGLKVTQIHQVVEYTPAACFQKFGDNISEARRAGDADPEKKIVAETRKLDGNSSYGKTVTNKERHTDVIYCQEHQVSRYLVDPSFRRCNQLSAKTFEVEMSKKTIRLDLPMQIGCFVYQYAKLRMLEFYYDFMDVFVDRRDFQYCAMDTDSAYMALSAGSLEEVIKPEMQQRYQMEKKNWFPRTDTPQLEAYDKRTPGLFKTEFTGDGMIALCSKTYFCFGAEDKFSCKGVNRKTNNVTKEKYMDVLLTKQSGSGTNRGFRTIDNQVYTYLQERAGFSYFYPKRKVLADGVSTAPLEI